MTHPLVLQAPPTCIPPRWARGGHAQTLLGHALPSRAPRLTPGVDAVVRHTVELPGGDRLVALGRRGTSGVCVSLFHGLGGDANADYVRRIVARLRERGHSVLAVNHRGCGAGRGLARLGYHSGSAADVGAALAFARALEPESLQVAIGFSLSGNALLLLLAREEHEGPRGRPDAAIAVNPPADLAQASRRISEGWNRVYDLRFVWRCRAVLRERVADGLLTRVPPVPRFGTLRDADETYTAPWGGFADASDYYARCSTLHRLGGIRRPTVVLHARDDPFVGAEALERARRSDCVHLHLEDTGGHMGYLARSANGSGAERWLDTALLHYTGELVRDAATREPAR